MTVGELLSRLREFDSDARVVIEVRPEEHYTGTSVDAGVRIVDHDGSLLTLERDDVVLVKTERTFFD